MSDMSGPGSVNRLLHQVQSFEQKEQPTKTETNSLVLAMKTAAGSFQSVVTGKVNAKLIDQMDTKTLNRLSGALAALGAKAVNGKGGENLGNVIQSLGELVDKLQQRKKEKEIIRKGTKVEKYEVVEFLNSTEKEFVRVVQVILDRDADEEALIAFIMELLRRMEVLSAFRKWSETKKITLQVDKKIFKRILGYIKELQESGEIHRYIYEIGISGEAGNTHLRFWKTLKQFQLMTEDFV